MKINIFEKALANGLDDYDKGNMDGNEIVNNSQMLIQEQQNLNSKNNNKMMMSSSFANKNINYDTKHTCQYYSLFDPNFTSEKIEIHQFREYPMLIPCFECNQIIEIPTLDYECKYKKDFKICPRCKEPVLV